MITTLSFLFLMQSSAATGTKPRSGVLVNDVQDARNTMCAEPVHAFGDHESSCPRDDSQLAGLATTGTPLMFLSAKISRTAAS